MRAKTESQKAKTGVRELPGGSGPSPARSIPLGPAPVAPRPTQSKNDADRVAAVDEPLRFMQSARPIRGVNLKTLSIKKLIETGRK